MSDLYPDLTLSTPEHLAALRPGDVVRVTDSRYPGVTVTGPLQEEGESLVVIAPPNGDQLYVRHGDGGGSFEARQIVEFVSAAPIQPNRAKLIELLAWATAEDVKRRLGLPSEWDQSVYLRVVDDAVAEETGFPCGTTCCIAGKTVLDAGYTPNLTNLTYSSATSHVYTAPGTRTKFVGDVAQEILGLTDDQRERLFQEDNSLADLREIILVEILDEPNPFATDIPF